MSTVYTSIPYELNLFGINQIKYAILSGDMDSGVSIELSFDGGSTFHVYTQNEKFEVNLPIQDIKVKIIFDDSIGEQYLINATGNYPMLTIGTSLYFESHDGTIIKTGIGSNGSYSVDLKNTTYTVWYMDSTNKKIILDRYFMPQYNVNKQEPLAKEIMVELFLKELPWAKYCIFDIFENLDKQASPINVSQDIFGNLIDPKTDKVCRWWAIGFTDE